jgi:hypothetical protein
MELKKFAKQILQFLRTFRAQVPVSGPNRYINSIHGLVVAKNCTLHSLVFFLKFEIFQTKLNCRGSPGGLYYLSYLDRDMLLGRAIGGGGVFIFTRAQPLN